MSALRCLIILLFGVLLTLAENYKSEDNKDQHPLPDEVKNESVERIRRQIGAFGYGIGIFGGRPIGNPYYLGNPYVNPYFVQPFGHYIHDRRFGGGFAGNFYGR
ncbi:uncharacterized protein LOC108116858 [Drosophila eugracilis]|uniref:uncharacterized protein LOC108116858 n=1 Tax=Drosophila eugracilis TaxID=29029 RepID=UPI0007E6D157|nr:uncharacterized protein LOC108116858 [Drosophila eugracilis]